MRQSGQEPEDEQRVEAGHERRPDVAEGHRQRQGDQQSLAWQPHRGGCEQWRPDDNTEGVGGDQMPGLRDADVQAVGHVGEQAEGDELARADAKAAHGEREQRSTRWTDRHGRHGVLRLIVPTVVKAPLRRLFRAGSGIEPARDRSEPNARVCGVYGALTVAEWV